MEYGTIVALGSAGLAALLPGIGSAIGIRIAGRSATGVLSEKPERYGQMFIMVVLPGTQGFYGFLAAFLVMLNLNFFGQSADPKIFHVPAVSAQLGWQVFAACLPIAFAGLVSAVLQGRVCSGGIMMAAKQPELAFKAGVVYAVMVEVYAVLGLLVTMFMLLKGIEWPTAG
jgi:V/A-type H+-transporting ATPase subunit K